MKAKWVTLVMAAIVILLGAFVTIGKVYLSRFRRRVFTEDAVLVICNEVHEMLERTGDVNDAEIDARIRHLFDASVINIRLNRNGEPVDLYGNPFQVSYKTEQGKTIITCVSFGPDGRQGTSDDIASVYDGTEVNQRVR